jgi:hypothetical protein
MCQVLLGVWPQHICTWKTKKTTLYAVYYSEKNRDRTWYEQFFSMLRKESGPCYSQFVQWVKENRNRSERAGTLNQVTLRDYEIFLALVP